MFQLIQYLGEKQLGIELYIEDEVLFGHIYCPSSLRLLDLLNQTGVKGLNSRNDYFIFDGLAYSNNGGESQEFNRLIVRKGAFLFVAVDDFDLGRGAGADRSKNGYPLTRKSPVRVILRLGNYWLGGNIHCCRGQTVKDLMNSDTEFLPLTDVTIAREQGVYGTKPFVAVNKEQIIWSQEE